MNIKEETVFSNVETANSKQLAILKKHFPNCFDRDGNFIQERMLEVVNDNEIELSKESYSLNWLGKSYSRLLANLPPKTLIHADVDHNAQEQHIDSKNLLIKGDNLEVLKHLVNAYSEKVKMIYIDPPYNTGSDGFVYNDDRKFTKEQLAELAGLDIDEAERILSFTDKCTSTHSAWLTFMYPRLYIARELLKEDGTIFVSIDDNELSQLKLICDEIFGESNFIGVISRSTGTRMGSGSRGVARELDYVVVYAKSDTASLNKLPMTTEQLSIYNEEDKKGKYLLRSLRRTGGENRREDRPSMFFPVINPDGEEVYPIAPEGWESRWVCGQETYRELIEKDEIVWKKVKKGNVEKWQIYQKHYPNDEGREVSDLWTSEAGNKKATKEVSALFGGAKVFTNPKSVDLIRQIILLGSNDGDLILDFFAGSGTTAHAVLTLNAQANGTRQFITVQLSEKTDDKSVAYEQGYDTIFDITKERIIRAAQQVKKTDMGNSEHVDLGFKIFETVEDFRIENDDKELTLSNFTMFDDVLLTEEQYQTLLTTWALYDGSELTTPIYDIDLDGYTAHLCDRRLYMIAPDFSSDALKALLHKLDDTDDKDFDPNKIVYYANNFDSVKQMELNEALKSYANKKSIEIDVVVRN
ncbi:site-specific DNA-methyltransferase [Vibrio vulnificus]|uniref:site-specific DNA-methyltransferase n=1 Tax=Vibrio vulnificus TaxID=672 RepID=UPI000D3E538D|nr:site-specific DNA-methyltransferase [Vibrio vulnificus]MBN8142234.1 site-specific DNA-methyltransferase [Vibrio vulnificus]MBN8151548.1 site-specific DNA-methyltransferase [Vibrio vulnificus]NIG93117.1 site-specific DNA-methyltransferase [Vibrio vulnificus]PUZ78848.1 type III restriction endonuclease subunit M [Vibrio vulnificus]